MKITQKQKERHYGKVQMLIEMIKSNEERMSKIGFGYQFDWKKVSEWMKCSEKEVNQIRDICYLLSERGIYDAVMDELLADESDESDESYEQFESDAKFRKQLYIRKWEEHDKYVKKHYHYPTDVLASAQDYKFLAKVALGVV